MPARRNRARKVPFLAMNVNGSLEVKVFDSADDAKALYGRLRGKYADNPTFCESDGAFSVSRPESSAVMVGEADVIGKGTRVTIA